MVAAQPINVIFIDDHRLIIDGMTSLLRDHPTIRVSGTFTNGAAALRFIDDELADGRLIDVAVCDLRLKSHATGLDFALQLRTRSPQTRVIILSMSEEPGDIGAAIQLGVAGYVSKYQDAQDISKAIIEVMRDSSRPYLSQEILRAFVSGLEPGRSVDGLKQLTPREIEILKLIAQEHTTAQIADKLFISEATVDTHRRNLIQKLGVRSIVGLANFAIRNGLV